MRGAQLDLFGVADILGKRKKSIYIIFFLFPNVIPTEMTWGAGSHINSGPYLHTDRLPFWTMHFGIFD